jgi:SAM-dependent methyltransferase
VKPQRGAAAWNHNSHYHSLLLASLPPGRDLALDVGCGTGDFAHQLSSRFKAVHAIDTDEAAIRKASSLYDGIVFKAVSFETFKAPSEGYDFISMIASLHHMDMVEAIGKAKLALKPGGVLAILGLYRETMADIPSSILSMALNAYFKMKYRPPPGDGDMVIADPKLTLREIRERLAAELPGSRMRRLQLWRYLAVWTKA